MSKLTDTQLVILSAAGARPGHAVLPVPPTLSLNKAALTTVINSLINRGLLIEAPATQNDAVWREEGDQRLTLIITALGLDAVGIEAGDAPSGPDAPPPAILIGRQTGKPEAVLALLRRPEGAGIADMNTVTGWQAHSIRAFLSGLRKKGMVLDRTKDADGKAVYRIAGEAGHAG